VAADVSVIAWSDFEKVDIRVGVVTDAEDFPEARRPALRLWIDFGPLGVKQSSAQITRHYRPEALVGRRVIAVVNFPPKRIGPFVSEVLVLGAYDGTGGVVLLAPDLPVAPGSRIG
jgi:tRNA-binding protein